MKKASYWDADDSSDNTICRLCPHNCIIPRNKRGNCNVRQNIDGTLYTHSYNRVNALNIDPIEKKPLYHFLPNSNTLSLGTGGCNLHCPFCQNHDLSQHAPDSLSGKDITAKELVIMAKDKNCSSISYTYSEPTIFFEYALEIAKKASKQGLKNIFVTNLFISNGPLNEAASYIDAFNIDLKSFSENTYKKTLKGSLEVVLDNIRTLVNLQKHIEITTLLVPGLNDSKAEIKKIAEFISSLDLSIPWHISGFHPDFKMTKNISITPPDLIYMAIDIAKSYGLRNVYPGNIAAGDFLNSTCSNCSICLVKRSGYKTEIVELNINGDCKHCGTHANFIL